MNTTLQKIYEDEIKAGDTQLEFKAFPPSAALLTLLIQEKYLQREKKQTMSDVAYAALASHLYFTQADFKDNEYFKWVAADQATELIVVTRKRFNKKIMDFAMARYNSLETQRIAFEAEEKAQAELDLKTKGMSIAKIEINTETGEITDLDPLDCTGPELADAEALRLKNISERQQSSAEEIETLQTDHTSLTELKEQLQNHLMHNGNNSVAGKRGRRSRAKGGEGERAVCKILQPVIDKVFTEAEELDAETAPVMKRNLNQTQDGGFDIVGIDFLAIEVKNVATLSLAKWFDQAKEQAGEGQHPVLVYKPKGKWRVMMFGQLPIGNGRYVQTNVDIDMSAFIVWFEIMLKQALGLDI